MAWSESIRIFRLLVHAKTKQEINISDIKTFVLLLTSKILR